MLITRVEAGRSLESNRRFGGRPAPCASSPHGPMLPDDKRSSYRILIPRQHRVARRVPWKSFGFVAVAVVVGYITVAAVLRSIERFP